MSASDFVLEVRSWDLRGRKVYDREGQEIGEVEDFYADREEQRVRFLSVSAGGGNYARGVNVEVGEEETAVDLTMAVEYGKSVPYITEAVRRNVINRVENLVGLRVTEVNIAVSDVQFREERPMLDQQQELQQQAREQEQQA